MDAPVAVSPAQLLLIDANAYANLVIMFPLPEGVTKEEDIPAFELPPAFRLLAVSPRDVVLVSKDPPGIFAYDREAHEWKPLESVQKPTTTG